MALKDQLDADMAHAVAMIKSIDATMATCTIGVTTYDCAIEEIETGESLEFAGMVEEIDAVVHIRRALFTGALPDAGDDITASGRACRIEKVIETPNGLEVRLLVKDLTK